MMILLQICMLPSPIRITIMKAEITQNEVVMDDRSKTGEHFSPLSRSEEDENLSFFWSIIQTSGKF